MRTYLVVIDDSPEASLALRFAARRAARTGGGVAVLAIIPPQDFVAFGGVQATIEAGLAALHPLLAEADRAAASRCRSPSWCSGSSVAAAMASAASPPIRRSGMPPICSSPMVGLPC